MVWRDSRVYGANVVRFAEPEGLISEKNREKVGSDENSGNDCVNGCLQGS